MDAMSYSHLDADGKRAIDIFRALSSKEQDLILAFAEALAQQQKREEDDPHRSARKAVEHACFKDMNTAKEIIGRKRMNTFYNVPDVMAGFGYVAGIAEGKRMERARRRASK